MATLKQLPVAPRTKVFRALVGILQHDPVIQSVVRGPNFRAWNGSSHDTMDFTFSSTPSIRITPTCGPDQWKFPSAQTGDLYLNVAMLIPGTDADDQFNLWWALELAIYPDNFAARAAIVAKLQAAGSYDGLVSFSQPAADPNPSDRFFAASGQMKITVLNQISG
jgi:hypothetical protein